MASPHPGMHVLCPVCEGPIPDWLGERTDEPAGIHAGTRSTDCYSCETPLLRAGFGALPVAPAQPPPAKRTARKRDLKFPDASGVDTWRAAVEQALQDEAMNAHRDPTLPPITRTKMVNQFGQGALEGYRWACNGDTIRGAINSSSSQSAFNRSWTAGLAMWA